MEISGAETRSPVPDSILNSERARQESQRCGGLHLPSGGSSRLLSPAS